MAFVVERVIKANKREIPPGLPPGIWWDKVEDYSRNAELLAAIPWWHSSMEYLSPNEMARVKAKALVWYEITGQWPTNIEVYWEVRMARRRGDHPHTAETCRGTVDSKGILHCGTCGARWSYPYPGRCKLCDRVLVMEYLTGELPRGMNRAAWTKEVLALMNDRGLDQEEAKLIVRERYDDDQDDEED